MSREPVPEQDSSGRGRTRRVLDALGHAQWTIRCTSHRIDELTALLGAMFRIVSKAEAAELAAFAELEAIAATSEGFVEILRWGPWSDVSRRRAAPPWWPALPDGWRMVVVRRRGRRDALEHRDGRLLVFESDDELVAFVRKLSTYELPPAPMLRVKSLPRARRRRAGGGGGDA